jgi:hypothetical protein
MLKQATLFGKINKKQIMMGEYYALFLLYITPDKLLVNERLKERLAEYVTEGKINDKGIKLVEEIDNLFKPVKKIKNLNLLGDDAEKNIDAFIELFPTHKLPNGRYARGNKKNIRENFMWFFQEYNYDWETVLKATQNYIAEYHRNNYQYMRTAMYFIKKVIDGTSISELANYCDMVSSNTDYTPERFIKTKVV